MRDILLDDNFQPIIKDGDFVIGDSSYQNLQLILLAQAGEWRNTPKVGVGVRNYLKAENASLREIVNDLQVQLEGDGAIVRSIDISEGTLQVDFDYL